MKKRKKFDLARFNRDNPVIEPGQEIGDPFVARVNEREAPELLGCWSCGGLYNVETGHVVGEADPCGEEVSSLSGLCKVCRKALGEGYACV